MKYLALCLLFFIPACKSPTKAFNLLTPDRVGLGRAIGSMSMTGFSHGGYHGQHGDNGWHHEEEHGDTWSDIEMDGESTTNMIWLEWDFPQWTDGSLDADADRYMRERIRHLNYRIHMMEEEEKNNRVIDDWLDMKR